MNWIGDEYRHFKDHVNEASLIVSRLLVAMGIVVMFFLILIWRFYNLQVVDYQDYATQSDRNRIQVRPAPPNRGLIYDRTGQLLAENRPTFTLSVVRERVKKMDDTLARLKALVPISEEDEKSFFKLLEQRRQPFESVPLRFGLNEAEIAKLAVNKFDLEGVEVEADLVRHYTQSELFAHTLGYVGRIDENELASFDEETYRRYSGTRSIGKIGLEKQYERQLLGDVGLRYMETDAHGRVIQVLNEDAPIAGQDLHLFLDSRLQQVAQKALDNRRGAVVAIEVATGGVLAMVSAPSFDPNLFVTGISIEDYKALNESDDLPLYNRTIQGQYPPGSTLKPMLGLGGLVHHLISPQWQISDPGFYQLENDERLYREWKKGGHQDPVDLHKAIVESCDIFFYDLAVRMGVDRMHPVGDAFGLGHKSGIDIPSERSGLWPSREWKKRTRGQGWYPGNSLNMSIGQGDVLATPLQLAVMTATIASRGKLLKPRLVERIGDRQLAPKELGQYQASEAHWNYIHKSMEDVAHGLGGTAGRVGRKAKKAGFRMAGKTGTAQVVGIAQDEKYDREKVAERNRDHALFIAFAPSMAPEIAVAVIVENGEHGSTTAAPVAYEVIKAYLSLPEEKVAGGPQ